MRAVGLGVTGTLDELLGEADVVVGCTPKRVATKNVEVFRRRGPKFILQGGKLFYAYMADNQAIVIPETIDRIRALSGTVKDARESITRTNAVLGIEVSLM